MQFGAWLFSLAFSYQPPNPVAAARGERSTYNPCQFPGGVGTRRRRSCGCRSSVFRYYFRCLQVMVLFSSEVVWNVGDLQWFQTWKCVMSWKKFLLFGEMVREVSFPMAAELVHCMSARFPVEGPLPVTDIFPKVRRKALFLPEELWIQSARVRAALEAAAGPSGDRMLDEAVEEDHPGRSTGWMAFRPLRCQNNWTPSWANGCLADASRHHPIRKSPGNRRLFCDPCQILSLSRGYD